MEVIFEIFEYQCLLIVCVCSPNMFFPAELEPDLEEGEVHEDDETDKDDGDNEESDCAVGLRGMYLICVFPVPCSCKDSSVYVVDHKVENMTQACCRWMCPEHLFNS